MYVIDWNSTSSLFVCDVINNVLNLLHISPFPLFASISVCFCFLFSPPVLSLSRSSLSILPAGCPPLRYERCAESPRAPHSKNAARGAHHTQAKNKTKTITLTQQTTPSKTHKISHPRTKLNHPPPPPQPPPPPPPPPPHPPPPFSLSLSLLSL